MYKNQSFGILSDINLPTDKEISEVRSSLIFVKGT